LPTRQDWRGNRFGRRTALFSPAVFKLVGMVLWHAMMVRQKMPLT
jgi:hypothetical protein